MVSKVSALMITSAYLIEIPIQIIPLYICNKQLITETLFRFFDRSFSMMQLLNVHKSVKLLNYPTNETYCRSTLREFSSILNSWTYFRKIYTYRCVYTCVYTCNCRLPRDQCYTYTHSSAIYLLLYLHSPIQIVYNLLAQIKLRDW